VVAVTLIDVALIGLTIAFLLALVRVIRGPTIADRTIAADLCFLTVIGVIALISVDRGVPEFVDVALVATLLGFLATIALAWLLLERWS
jgi:multicomponent Na+:H+ antiporter subunit F